ncbi:MAG TPA: DUF4105 domain-containing protein [Gemmatimonadales bacterium]|nr:DUF4105 domain-containing protein [Gemmatimonadales bacterium]
MRAAVLALLSLAATAHRPAPRAAQTPGAEPGAELIITLLTFEPGGQVWERFGHNGIWVHDAAAGTDHLYDWGRFDFNAPNFFLHFAQGKMWYSMGDNTDVAGVAAFYAGEGRKAWAQELDLTPAQRLQLREFLEWNIRPEHAGYAYDYYRDNCSTRLRDALDRVLGGSIARYGAAPSGFTWREETRRLDQHNAALYTGLMVALGQPVDHEMTRWEQMFLPIRLREHLDSVTVTGPDGVARPLVKQERVLNDGGRYPVPARPSSWTVRYLLVGVLTGGLLVFLGGGSLPAQAPSPAPSRLGARRWFFLALATLWSLLAGILGLVLTWLWVFSIHLVAHSNENILLFNLLALALAIVLPSAVRGKAWAAQPARRLALAVAVLAALGLALKVLPSFYQSNLELIALALPVHAGLVLGLSRAVPRTSRA